jgi:geranylgeranyl reductase
MQTTFTNVRSAAGVARRGAEAHARANAVAPLAGRRSAALAGVAVPTARTLRAAGRAAAGLKVVAVADGATLDRPLRVAVIGGGPAGASAAESLAKGGVEAFLIERKMDNCKVRAGFARRRRPPPAISPHPPRNWPLAPN